MNSKFCILAILVFLVAACGKAPDSSQQGQAGADSHSICVSNFLNPTQVNQVLVKMNSPTPGDLVLQASILTQAVAAEIGTEKTLEFLQSGLLSDWLKNLTTTDFCKTKNGDSL